MTGVQTCALPIYSTPGFPVLHYLLEFAQTHVHRVSDAIQPSRPLLSFNLSQHQGLFQWVNSSPQLARVLELQLQHQSYQRIFRVNFLQNDRFDDLFAVQETFSCLFQHHSWKVLILWCSAFFMVQLSHLYMTLEKTLLCLYAALSLTNWYLCFLICCLGLS